MSLAAEPLVCVECGREQDADERGWRSLVTTDEDGPAEAPPSRAAHPEEAAR